ncbi:GyrI-like domain-containing protein [Dokdonia sp. Hel_I_53]|uniref:GyrI-like domain-containing protein n=1 Tax=Dokdonia sp. Hel_I_53 TaxID=1566287 RepID=UPI00119B34DF|nr:GyrI-like domain-containing protein [Dokdonia sp. Hel_I_53]TVZ52903.1 effector-binding domain-containing protein [Dokdonia sp. Hel_I_53]
MKKAVLLVLVIILMIMTWFMFIKPDDYIAKLSVRTNVGTVNQTLKSWNRIYNKNYPILQINTKNLIQKLSFNDSIHTYNWNLERKHDSLTDITIYITDEKLGGLDRLKKVFFHTSFERRSKATVLQFTDFIRSHLENIKIEIDGLTILPRKDYAYTEFNGPQDKKVSGMMRDILFIENKLVANNLQLDGPPFLNITHWDTGKDSISYQFAFPIKSLNSLPQISGIKFGIRHQQKVLKATYNGNYITSDRAWYALLQYAETHNIEAIPLPIEVFYNNPNMGGNELDWKVEIFLPINE